MNLCNPNRVKGCCFILVAGPKLAPLLRLLLAMLALTFVATTIAVMLADLFVNAFLPHEAAKDFQVARSLWIDGVLRDLAAGETI